MSSEPTATTPAAIYRPRLRAPREEARLDPATMAWGGGLLVRSTNWLGDALMTLPAIWRMHQALPAETPLIILTAAKLERLWHAVPFVDTVVPFQRKRLSSEERRHLRALAPGATVILPNSFGSASDLWRARLPHRIGRRGRARDFMLDHRLDRWTRRPGEDTNHQINEYMDIAAACGADAEPLDCPPLQPRLTADEQAQANSWSHWPEPRLLIAPGAAYGPAKQWPATHFAALGKRWQAATGGTVIAVGAPGEEAVAAAAIDGVPGAQNLAGATSLTQLMHLLAAGAAVVANDSGSMHLAAALGCRGVAIFGSTDPIATGPIGGTWIVLQHPLPCQPCLQRTCALPESSYACLTTITDAQVWEALDTLLPELALS